MARVIRKVIFTRHAEHDLLDIISWIKDKEGSEAASRFLEKMIQARDNLHHFPQRGRIPPELMYINIRTYREIQVFPYRVIYQVSQMSSQIYIHLVADGRRNFTELLKNRLLIMPDQIKSGKSSSS